MANRNSPQGSYALLLVLPLIVVILLFFAIFLYIGLEKAAELIESRPMATDVQQPFSQDREHEKPDATLGESPLRSEDLV